MKIKKLEQKLKEENPRYSVDYCEDSQTFTIYYKLDPGDLWGREKFPLFRVSWRAVDEYWEIGMDMRIRPKHIDLVIYPLELLKKLDKPKEKK